MKYRWAHYIFTLLLLLLFLNASTILMFHMLQSPLITSIFRCCPPLLCSWTLPLLDPFSIHFQSTIRHTVCNFWTTLCSILDSEHTFLERSPPVALHNALLLLPLWLPGNFAVSSFSCPIAHVKRHDTGGHQQFKHKLCEQLLVDDQWPYCLKT